MTGPRSIVDVARRHAAQRGSRTAYVILGDGENATARRDFTGIDRRARAVAVALRERGAAGQRLLICYPTSMAYVESFLGCLYAGAVAVPCGAPGGGVGAQRLRGIRADCAPSLVLRGVSDAAAPALDGLAGLDVADVPDDLADQWADPGVMPHAPALLQYTSGSTRAPRGVRVDHGNILANEDAIRIACGNDGDSTFVGWLPLFHDMGLIANLLQPLYLGSTSVLMPPMAFLQKPVRWLAAITAWGAHTSGGPNFAYDLCVDRIAEADRASLDLSSWLVAYNGAEPVRAATMTRFSAAFVKHGFADSAHFPCYGLAEATLLVAAVPKSSGPVVVRADAAALRAGTLVALPDSTTVGASLDPAPVAEVVSCGPPVTGTDVCIANPDTVVALPEGRVGEVWVRAGGVSPGYWGSREPETFSGRLGGTGAGPYLRTGDLGALLGGELHVTGRLRDRLIIRGQNHFPHDLEWCAENADPAVRPSAVAAFGVDVAGTEEVVLCLELTGYGRDVDATATGERVLRALADQHGVAAHAVMVLRRGGVPKTTSGKVRRLDCRTSYLAGSLPVYTMVYPATVGALPDRQELTGVDRATAVARLADALAGSVGCGSDESLGLDSMAATALAHRLQEAYGAAVGTADVLGADNAGEIAELVLDRRAAAPATDLDAPVTLVGGWQPLTAGQRSIWYELGWDGVGAAYHLARVLRLRPRAAGTGAGAAEGLDLAALTSALDAVVRRHPALRSRFALVDGEPRCRVVEPDARRGAAVGGELEPVDGVGVPRAELLAGLVAEAEAPFDLAVDPPIRVRLVDTGADGFLLLVVVHHLVADLWTVELLLRDLRVGYAAARSGLPLPAGPDAGGTGTVLAAERAYLESRAAERDGAFWRERLAGAAGTLDLPLCSARPAVRTFRGGVHPFRLSADRLVGLHGLGRENDVTLFVVLLAAYRVLLHRITDQTDIVVGTVLANRDDAALADVAGHLANPVPLRDGYRPGESFRTLLRRTGRAVHDALAHGRYPFTEMAADIVVERSAGHATLVQSRLVLQREYGSDAGVRALALGVEGELKAVPGFDESLRWESVPIRWGWSQLDLGLTVAEIDGGLTGTWEYRTDLFDAAAVASLSSGFDVLLESFVADPGRPLRSAPLLTGPDLASAHARSRGPLRPRAAVSLTDEVRGTARRVSDAIAVSGVDARGRAVQLSHTALQRLAGQVAGLLRDGGVGPGHPVGVLLDRVVELPAAYLAIGIVGATVLPLQADLPDGRVATMIADSGARVVLTAADLVGGVPDGIEPIVVDGPGVGTTGIAPVPGHPELPAYLMYTSGSTGRPKGVTVPTRAIVNRIRWMQEEFGLRPYERVLHKTPIGFDVALWELYWPLVAGGVLVLAPPGAHRDPEALVAVLDRERIAVAHFVPTVLGHLLSVLPGRRFGPFGALRDVVCSGEVLDPELAARFRSLLDAGLHNLFGPTEAAVDVTAWRCRPEDTATVAIGHPIANVVVEVLGDHLSPVPDRVPGQLHLGGVCPAHGYLGQPSATAASFLPAPNGTRRYRTGDRARRRPDGALEFLGRVDGQIKIGGNRVEPDEVAHVLRRQAGVRDAVVVAGTRFRAGSLVGYVVRDPAAAPPDAAVLRDLVAAQLPAFMVPAAIVVLDRLPVTANGKLDRSALPEPAATTGAATEPGDERAQPITATEQAVAALWSEQFGGVTVPVDASFFDLGGDSIQALRTVAAARRRGWSLGVVDILRARTVRSLAALLDTRSGPAAEIHPAGRGEPFRLCPDARGRPGVEDAYPISFGQRALLFHRGGNETFESYLTSVEVGTPLPAGRLDATWQATVSRHAYLRSTFDLTSYPEPVQLVHTALFAPVSVVDLSGTPVAEQDETVHRWLAAERTSLIDVEGGPLVRLTAHDLGDRFRLTVTSFALDGWSDALVLTEVVEELLTGRAPTGPVPDYAGFVAAEQAVLTSPGHREFWAAELDGAPRSAVPRSSTGGAPRPGLRERWILEVDRQVDGALAALAARLGVGTRHVLLGVHMAVVRLLTGSVDCVTGLHVNGRPDEPGGDRVVGVFNNIIPLRFPVRGSWADLARAAYAAELRVLEFRRSPTAYLQREFRAANAFDTLFVFTHFHPYRELQERIGVDVSEPFAPDQTYVPLTAHVNRDARSGTLRLLLEHDPAEYATAHVAAIGEVYRRALEAAITHPDRDHRDADLAAQPARADPVSTTAAARVPIPAAAPSAGAGTLSGLLADAARARPDRLAMRADDGWHTYSGLLRGAAALAGALRRSGVGPDVVVAFPAPRSGWSVRAMLAVLLAGGAYLPLDPADPAPRRARIVRAAGARVVVLPAGELVPDWAAGAAVVRADATGPPCAVGHAHPEQLACVLATSGSTGAPKVVGIPNRGLVAYLRWATAMYGIGPDTVSLVHTALSFDLTVTSLWGPLMAGGCVELLADPAPTAAGTALGEGRHTLLKTTPSHLLALREQWAVAGGPRALRTVVVGGEAMHAEHARAVRSHAPNAMLVNEYGPTETVVGCCAHAVGPGPVPDGPVPIGLAIGGARLRVVDDGVPLPVEVSGELWVGGDGVTRGYLGHPAATAAAFVPEVGGGRRYRTGDRVHAAVDGGLRFEGRDDAQVKVRGFRVETAEIEEVLAGHPEVAAAAVVARRTPDGRMRLVGYWTARSGSSVDPDDPLRWLRTRLPPYLVPARLRRLAALPTTSHGKIDRVRLAGDAQEHADLVARIALMTDEEAASLLSAPVPVVDGEGHGGSR